MDPEESEKWPYLADATVTELCRVIAKRMRAERIRQVLTQRALAEKAGLALRTYRRLEATGEGSVENLMAVLKALGRTPIAALMFPQPTAPTNGNVLDRIRRYAYAPRPRRRASTGRT